MKLKFPIFSRDPTLVSFPIFFVFLLSVVFFCAWAGSKIIPFVMTNFTPDQAIPGFFALMLGIMFVFGYIKIERE